MQKHVAKFHVGQLVSHLKYGYRGVIFDIDPVFDGSDEWYEFMAKSNPPKDLPWYHVLVDQQQHNTYVAERHLTPDESRLPVTHPLINSLFREFSEGTYRSNNRAN